MEALSFLLIEHGGQQPQSASRLGSRRKQGLVAKGTHVGRVVEDGSVEPRALAKLISRRKKRLREIRPTIIPFNVSYNMELFRWWLDSFDRPTFGSGFGEIYRLHGSRKLG